MKYKRDIFIVSCIVLLLVGTAEVKGQWLPDGNPVTTGWTTDDPQSNHCVIQDGEGGTIVVWHECGDGFYSQRFSADGSRMWNEEAGVFLCDSSEDTGAISPHAVLMGDGSVIVVWQKRDVLNNQGDIYAQKFDAATGTLSWATSGKIVCDDSSHQFRPRATKEGLITWLDQRDGSNKIYMQKLDSSGIRQWGNGRLVVDIECWHYDYQIASVPNFRKSWYSGGILVVFTGKVEVADCSHFGDMGIIGAQWVTPGGSTPWGSEGISVLDSAIDCISYVHPRVIGEEGSIHARAYIVAERHDFSSDMDMIFAAGIYQTPTREIIWRTGISAPAYNEEDRSPCIAMTGGHLVCTWERTHGSLVHIYASRFSRKGKLDWFPIEMPICSDYSPVAEHSIAANGPDRITVTWKYNNDIYARSVKTSEDEPVILTDAADEILCSAYNGQESPRIVSDSAGGALVAWIDYRHDNKYPRVYMNRLDPPERYCELFVPKSSRLAMGSPVDLVIEQESIPEDWSGLIYIDQVDIYASYDGGEFILIDSVFGSEINRVEGDLLWVPWQVSGYIADSCRLGVHVVFNDNTTAWDESGSDIRISHYSVDWATNGMPVAAEPGEQTGSCLVETSDDAYIVSWEGWDKNPSSPNNDMYASKFSRDGDPLWNPPIVRIGNPGNLLNEHGHNSTSDDSGGAVVVCLNDTWNSHNQLLAYHVDANGVADWTSTIRDRDDYDQYDPVIASDGNGGSFIAWYEHHDTNYDLGIRVMHLDADGNAVSGWPNGGKCVFTRAVVDDVEVEILPIGENEFLVAYTKQAYSDNIYLRRVSGSSIGAEFPVSSTTACVHRHPCLVPDAADGIFVVWQEYSPFHMGEKNIYAQRIRLNGSGFERLWSGYGLPVCNWSGNQYWPRAVQDGSGGFVVVWHDGRAGDQYDIYAERVDSNGNKLWGPYPNPDFSGIPVCEAAGDQFYQDIVNVGGGQFVASWVDMRDLAETECHDIYVEKIESDGTLIWGNGGIQITGSVDYRGDYFQPYSILADDVNGAVLVWNDTRYAFPTESDPGAPVLDMGDILIQRVGGDAFFPTCESVEAWIINGDSIWATGDTVLYGCPGRDYQDYRLIVRCRFNELDMSRWGWLDPADFTIDTVGLPFSFCSLDAPDTAGTPDNDFSSTLVRNEIRGCSGCDGQGCDPSTVPGYDVPVLYQGVEIGTIPNLMVRSIDATNDGIVDLSELTFFGLTYNKSLEHPGYDGCYDFNGDGWVDLSDFGLLGEHWYHKDSCYMEGVPPRMMLNMESRIALHGDAFSAGSDPGVIRVALKLNNLSGVTTAALTFEYAGDVMVFRRWVPSQGLHDKTAVSSSAIDKKGKLFVAAFDMHSDSDAMYELGYLEFYSGKELESIIECGYSGDEVRVLTLISGEAIDVNGRIMRIGDMTGSVEVPVYHDRLGNNYPNPFNPSTVIEYSLANDLDVELSVYSVNGQRVRTLVNAHQKKGTYSVVWDGRNNVGLQVASGVYFYRIKAGKFVDSKKMILLR